MTEDEFIEITTDLLGSPLKFAQYFYPVRTGRDFRISRPCSSESHFIIICRALLKVFKGETKRLIINVPPRYGKTELLINFIAWSLANYPDSTFLYVSYSHRLAEKQTKTIRDIVSLPHYKKMFAVDLNESVQSKGDFETTKGGCVYAAGAGGTIVGRGAGILGCERFGGAIIIDDIHKPDEAPSDVIRENIKEWYYNTMQSRLNDGHNTPIIFIGQRVHEDDLAANLLKEGGWESIVLPAVDILGNVLYPEMHSKEELLSMQTHDRYVFAAQYLQNPQPSGGGIYKTDDFQLLDLDPKIIASFITADTAETDKTWNDKTVFSFWGVYKITNKDIDSGLFGLFWLDCEELNIEPKDLEDNFWSFYTKCMQYKCKPSFAAIEKKSTGVTLCSVLKDMSGLRILEIKRTSASGSKTQRFLEAQPYIARKQLSLPARGAHTKMCLDHMCKITANDTHRFDDICDTAADAIKLTFVDKIIERFAVIQSEKDDDAIINKFARRVKELNYARGGNSW